jgi:hypothetical protein
VPPRADQPDLPGPLEQLILRCLQKSPEQRPRDVAELAEGLAPFAPPERAGVAPRVARILAGRVGLDASVEVADEPAETRDREASLLTASRTAPVPPAPAPSRRPRALGGALLAALGGLAWAASRLAPAATASAAPSAPIASAALAAPSAPAPGGRAGPAGHHGFRGAVAAGPAQGMHESFFVLEKQVSSVAPQ